jgi:hypothetical protein
VILGAKKLFYLNGMSSIALGIWVGFFKQPALPGEAPQKILQKKANKAKVYAPKNKTSKALALI